MDKKTVQIHVVGARQLQNELLVSFIENEMGLPCILHNENQSAISFNLNQENSCFLWDCMGLAPADIWSKIMHVLPSFKGSSYLALIHLKQDKKFEIDALSKGVRGVFYEQDSLSSFNKGLNAIVNDELWFSREILSKSLQQAQKYSDKFAPSPASILTCREKEILSMVASGASNSSISESLHISPHTVKSHINNIYGKIKAPSRVQAVLWAARNL